MKEGSQIVNQSKEAARKRKKRRGGTSFSGSKEKRRRELRKKVVLSEIKGETVRKLREIGHRRVHSSKTFESGIVDIVAEESEEDEEKGVRFKRLSAMRTENERAARSCSDGTDSDDETAGGSIATVRMVF